MSAHRPPIIIITIAIFLTAATTVTALNMDSAQFRIKDGNINIGARQQSSSSYNIDTTLGQTAANEFSSSGYVVKAGFQYIHSIIPFRFTVSNTNINLGTLLANTPATATTSLTISFGLSGEYQVTAAELTQLQTLSGNTIPDTACNGGANTCTETTAKIWNSSSAYGFGYSMSGEDIPADFINNTYYRPFGNLAAAGSPRVVMSNTNVTLDPSSSPRNSNQSTMTIKANVSSIQPAGTYQTVIQFIATPSY